MTNVLAVLLPALLGGGFLSALVTWYVARKKMPAETDSIIVGGAETAVLTLQQVLASSEAARKALVSDNESAHLAIAGLRIKVDQLQKELDNCRRGVDDEGDSPPSS